MGKNEFIRYKEFTKFSYIKFIGCPKFIGH